MTALPLLLSLPPSGAQAPPPDRLPGTRVELRADPTDQDTFIPPPVRMSGVAAEGAATPPPPPTATIQVTYAAGFPDHAKPPLAAVTAIWAGIITSSQPITVLADYRSLGFGTLAAAGPSFVFRDFPNAPVPNTFYAQPLAEALSGQNLGGSDYDVLIDINVRNDWYFGTDGNTPSGQFDLMSVLLHEFLHGLGFLGTMDVDGALGYWGLGSPARADIYDRFLQSSTGTSLLNTSVYPNPSIGLRNALQSGAVFFSSPQTNRGLADRVRLYAPNPWNGGSSIAHFDEASYPPGSANSLPTPFLNSSEAVHSPGPLTLCVLEAMGWSTPQDCTPPARTQVNGFTWFASGGFEESGPSGTTVRAYATGAIAGRTYRLVSAVDGGTDTPCMWDAVPINANSRVASGNGVISLTTGTINRAPGKWQICFREESTGSVLQVTVPTVFEVR